MQECRPCRAHCRIVCCIPRVSYRALPSFHPGLCRGVALAGLIVGLGVCPQGFISGFALIPPWALQECRPFRALCTLLLFSQGFISGFALISPWAMQECRPFRALCRIGCVYPGFHIGLCPHFTLGHAGVSPFQGSLSDWLRFPRVSYRASPHFTLGYAGVPPFQGSLSYWLFAVLCRGIVFVKCVWVCKWIVVFGRVFV